MASVTATSCLYSRPFLSPDSIVFEGLRVQSPNCLGAGKPNSNVGFHRRVYKSIQSRCGKATRSRISMMAFGTPKVPYRNPGENTWQWIDVWNALYREGVVCLGKYIDDDFSNQILGTMLYLDSIYDSKAIYLLLTCPGGDITPSLAIYDTMQSLTNPVATHSTGFAFDMVGFILAAGKKGLRSITPRGRVLLHSPAGAARGQADDIRNEAGELIRTRDYVFKKFAKHTGQPVDKIHKDLSRLKCFNPQEALEYGIVDRIARAKRIKDSVPRKNSTAGLG